MDKSGSIPDTPQNYNNMATKNMLRSFDIKCPLSIEMANYYLSLGHKIIFRKYRIGGSYDYCICKFSSKEEQTLHEEEILSINDIREILSHEIFDVRFALLSQYPYEVSINTK